MKRRRAIIIAVLSLALCVAVVGLWVDSYKQPHFVQRATTGLESTAVVERRLTLICHRGTIVLATSTRTTDYGRWVPVPVRRTYGGEGLTEWVLTPPEKGPVVPDVPTLLGFGILSENGPPLSLRGVVLPCAAPALVLATPAIMLFAHSVRRARRQERGACLACGYDLRATPGRCPECGWAASVTSLR
jgi:hypothetical protein